MLKGLVVLIPEMAVFFPLSDRAVGLLNREVCPSGSAGSRFGSILGRAGYRGQFPKSIGFQFIRF